MTRWRETQIFTCEGCRGSRIFEKEITNYSEKRREKVKREIYLVINDNSLEAIRGTENILYVRSFEMRERGGKWKRTCLRARLIPEESISGVMSEGESRQVGTLSMSLSSTCMTNCPDTMSE